MAPPPGSHVLHSILPVISKMLEKHVHDSLMTYLTSHKLLHSTQSGFRPNHSCETALLQMINKFLEAINNSQIIGLVMIDFRKAFDLVDHTLLLKKLRHYKQGSHTTGKTGKVRELDTGRSRP